MTNFMKRFALVLCLVALCVSLLGVSAFAVSYDPVTATVPVQIALSGYLPEEPDSFQIQVTAEDPAFPMPAGAENGVYVMDMLGDTTASFDITFDEHGIYTYTVEQLPLGNEDCYQDTHTYQVIAQVVNNEDYTAFDLIVVVYRDDQEEKRDDILFENRYALPTEVQLTATKTMDKKLPMEGAFSFELLDETGGQLEAVKNDAEGNVTFLPISYYKSGTYTYTIREIAGKDSTIIYDKTTYTAVVEVTKDDNGDYTAALSYAKGEQAVEGAAFANMTKPIIPQTGDNANLLLWGSLMVLALAVIAILLLSMKKKSGKA